MNNRKAFVMENLKEFLLGQNLIKETPKLLIDEKILKDLLDKANKRLSNEKIKRC